MAVDWQTFPGHVPTIGIITESRVKIWENEDTSAPGW